MGLSDANMDSENLELLSGNTEPLSNSISKRVQTMYSNEHDNCTL